MASKSQSLRTPRSFLLGKVTHPGRWHLPFRAINKALRMAGLCCYVETSYGIKYLGKGLSSDHFGEYVIETHSFADLGCSFDEFIVPPDFLVDTYSLTGFPVIASPYYCLVDVLSSGKDLLDTQYVYRFERGILDLRRGKPIDEGLIRSRYRERLEQMHCHNLPAVKAFLVEQNEQRLFVIGDGKHRLAMAAYFDYRDDLRISLLDPGLYKAPFFQYLYQRASRKPRLYRKNLQVLEAVYGSY